MHIYLDLVSSYINASLQNEVKLSKTEKRRYVQYLGEFLIEKISL